MTKERKTKIYACNSEAATSCYILQFIINSVLQISGGFETGNKLHNVDSTVKFLLCCSELIFHSLKGHS